MNNRNTKNNHQRSAVARKMVRRRIKKTYFYMPLEYTVVKAEVIRKTEDSEGITKRLIRSTFYMNDDPTRLLEIDWILEESPDQKSSTPYNLVIFSGDYQRSRKQFLDHARCCVPEKPIIFELPDDKDILVTVAGNENSEDYWERKTHSRIVERTDRILSIYALSKQERNRREQIGRSSPQKQMDFSWESAAKSKIRERKNKFEKVKTIYQMLKKAVGSKNAIIELRKAGML